MCHLGRARPKSYRRSFRENAVSEFVRQCVGRKDVHLHAQQFRQFVIDRADIEQTRFPGRIDKNVDVALVGVLAARDRAEDARIRRAVGGDNGADRFTMGVQTFGWSHIPATRLAYGKPITPCGFSENSARPAAPASTPAPPAPESGRRTTALARNGRPGVFSTWEAAAASLRRRERALRWRGPRPRAVPASASSPPCARR